MTNYKRVLSVLGFSLILSFSLSAQDIPQGLTTPCGFNGTRTPVNYSVNWNNLSSKRARYGPCIANSAPGCKVTTGFCRTDESERAEIIELVSRWRSCSGLPPENPVSEQRIEDWGLTHSLPLLRRMVLEVCRSTPPASVCPQGQTCQFPCQVCQPCLTCPPITDSIIYTKDRLPVVGVSIEFWDRGAKMKHQGVMASDGRFFTQGGVFSASDIYAWRLTTSAPEVK